MCINVDIPLNLQQRVKCSALMVWPSNGIYLCQKPQTISVATVFRLTVASLSKSIVQYSVHKPDFLSDFDKTCSI